MRMHLSMTALVLASRSHQPQLLCLASMWASLMLLQRKVMRQSKLALIRRLIPTPKRNWGVNKLPVSQVRQLLTRIQWSQIQLSFHHHSQHLDHLLTHLWILKRLERMKNDKENSRVESRGMDPMSKSKKSMVTQLSLTRTMRQHLVLTTLKDIWRIRQVPVVDVLRTQASTTPTMRNKRICLQLRTRLRKTVLAILPPRRIVIQLAVKNLQ